MTIHLDVVTTNNHKRVVPHEPTPIHITVGEDLDVVSALGSVAIHLDSPNGLNSDSFTSGGPALRATLPGHFILRCTVTFPDGTVVGWGKDAPESGTEVIIEGGGV
jgi:hypothetical protein